MPGLVSSETMEGGVKSDVEIGNGENHKSPRSPLSPRGNNTNNSGENEIPQASIEQLYENVRGMKSSGDQSSSRVSSAEQSEDDSRIDSELQHLAGVEKGKDRPSSSKTPKGSKGKSPTVAKSSGKETQTPSKITSSADKSKNAPERSSRPVTINQPKKPPKLVVNSEKGTPSPNKVTPKSLLNTSTSKPKLDDTLKSANSNAQDQSNNATPEETSNANSNSNTPLQKKLFGSPRKSTTPSPVPKRRLSSPGLSKLQKSTDSDINDMSELALDNPDLGPFLLKLARSMITSGDNPYKALDCASRASKSFEKCADGKPSSDFVMSLHILAAIHCSLGQYQEAIPVLERSIEVSALDDGPEHALAAFAGRMQLGDTYAMLGQLENSIECYKSGLEIQKQALGDMDPRVGETCRYLAEAHVQAMQFDEAEKLCQHALDIHKEHREPASPEEVADRRLMALICDGKGDYEASLEHLVLASMAMISNGQEGEVASIDCSIGDTYLAIGRYDEAVFSYQKSLTVFKSTKGENHPCVATVYVRLADLYHKTEKLRESKSYCENALRIYNKPNPIHPSEDIAGGLTELAAIYEAMNETDQALRLLQKALKLLDDSPGQQSAIAGIEAQMGVIYYVLGKYGESYSSFKSAVTKLRASGERKSSFFGVVLNQMGLTCVQRYAINEAADLFEESRGILEEICGPYHPDTLAVCSNLAGTYDAMGRLEDAIGVLEYIVAIREEKLGTANPDVDDEKRRLTELLKEAGRARSKKPKSLENLLETNIQKKKKEKSK